VVIANQNDPAAILAGAVLARANVGSLLLSGVRRLPPNVAAEAARMSPRARDDEAATRNVTGFTPSQGTSTVTCQGCFQPGDVGSAVRNANFPPDTVITQVIDPNTAVVNNTATGNTAGPVTFAPQVGAFVLGSPGQLSEQVRTDLANATGLPIGTIKRIDGTPAQMAAQIARQMDRRATTPSGTGPNTLGDPAFEGAVIVNPASPDAAAVSVLAASRRLPVLFASGDTIPPATAGALASLNIPNTIVVGRNRWIGDAVLPSLPRAHRIGGNDAVATSRVLLAESRRRGLPTNIVYSARASRRMDAALLGFAAGRMTGILLLTHRGETQVPGLLNQLRIRGSVDRVIAVDGLARRRGR